MRRSATDPRWWGPPLGGLLFALAYPPLDLLPLALVGPWGLLAFLDREVAEGRGLRRAFTGGMLFGLAMFGALLYWIAGLTSFSLMAVPAYVASVLVLSLNGGLTAWAVAFAARRGVPVALSFPLAWTAVEWMRTFGDLGFGWTMAADAAASYPLLIQTAELGGPWLVTLWLLGLSSLLWRLARPLAGTRRPALAAATVLVALAVPVYGALRLAALESRMPEWPVLRAAAIQPNVPQSLKWEGDFEGEVHRRLVRLTRAADVRDPQLVVWPESALPSFLRYDRVSRELVPRLAAEIEAPIFTGTNDADTLPGRSGELAEDYHVFNAAYLVLPDSLATGRYAKRRLVPVAERVPFLPGPLRGVFERLSAWTGQFQPGATWTTWEVDGHRIGALICYESVFPDVTRRLARSGADVLLNVTNDAWFGPTAAPYQHASHLALRAVEVRVPFLRAANTGISGWVDPLGRWHDATDLFVPAVVVADLPVPSIETPFTRWGDWVPLGATWIWGGLCLAGLRRRRVVAPRDRG